MSETSVYKEFKELMGDPEIKGIVRVSNLEPIGGAGSAINPSTYPEGNEDKLPAGPAISRNGVIRYLDSDSGTAKILRQRGDGRPILGDSAIISSVGAEATRQENALWNLRDELDLPGIEVVACDDIVLENVFDECWEKVKKSYGKAASEISERGKEELFKQVRVAISPVGVSSWTLAHRHTDGIIRLSKDCGVEGSDKERHIVATPDSDPNSLYSLIARATPTSLSDLLLLSPNSVAYGYWLSTNSTFHARLARSVASEITGYGVNRVSYGAVKGAPWEAHKGMYTNDDGELVIMKASRGSKRAKDLKKPSEIDVSNALSRKSNYITCQTILGTTSISVSNLRNVLKTGGIDPGSIELAINALVSLPILGTLLNLEDGFLRSGTDLIDTESYWTAVKRGSTEKISIPINAKEFFPIAKMVIEEAQNAGVLGTKRRKVEMSERLAKIFVSSYIESFLSAGSDEKESD